MRILHISDLHVGTPVPDYEFEAVKKRFLEDVAEITEGGPPVELIVFTGDLAFGNSGKASRSFKDQVAQGVAFLETVGESVVETGQDVPPIVVVPGNHDIDREVGATVFEDWVRRIGHSDLDWEIRQYKKSVKSGYGWKIGKERREEWTSRINEFHQNQTYNFAVDDDYDVPRLRFTSISGLDVAIAGLNSAWSSIGDGDRGTLSLGRSQLAAGIEFASDADLRIVAMHHPTHWLNSEDESFAKERIATSFDIFLHGHIHSAWFPESRAIAAGALFEREESPNSYNLLDVNVSEGEVELRGREYTSRGSGGFRPLVIPGMTDSDGLTLIELRSRSTNGQEPVSTVAPTTPPGETDDHDSPASLCTMLHRQTGFSFWPNRPKGAEIGKVYWPVRQRRSLIIHAVQALVAGELGYRGADVVLAVDDLGRPESTVEHEVANLERWMGAIRAGTKIERRIRFSEFVDADESWEKLKRQEPWGIQTKLLTAKGLLLRDLLRASKILRPDAAAAEDFVAALEQEYRGKKILGTIINYALFASLVEDTPTSGFITLGGWDERPLWEIWRDHLNQATGHLFVPEIQGVRMDRDGTDLLRWSDQEELEGSIDRLVREDLQRSLVQWLVEQGTFLPRLLSGDLETLWQEMGITGVGWSEASSEVLDSLSSEPSKIASLAERVSDWYHE